MAKKLTTNEMIALGAIAAGGVGLYLIYRNAYKVNCKRIANSRGGTFKRPCPTRLPLIGGILGDVDIVCTGADRSSWQERLRLQISTLSQLQSALQQTGLLTGTLADRFSSYLDTAPELTMHDPLFEGRVANEPILEMLRVGCDLQNEGNRVLIDAGHRDLIVPESATEKRYRKEAAIVPQWLWLTILVAGAWTAYYYWGQYRTSKI